MATNVADLRQDYTLRGLSEEDCAADPIKQFQQWFEEAVAAGIREPNAMTLATCTPDGTPSARVVLLKGYDERGLQFFTNYESRKGVELANNPKGAIVFLWVDLERQIRIEGTVVKTTEEESEAYFYQRPVNSRLGAWASDQSRVVSGREELAARHAELAAKYRDSPIPKPPHWGGYRLVPAMFEFWQGRPSRLHDRIRYRLVNGAWIIDRLSP
jgi:pyridoxamine 5'-phosphate oxidase